VEYFSTIIKRSIQKRREGSTEENRQDFLQMMLEAQAGQTKIDEKELDNYEKDALLKDTATGTAKRDLAVVLDDETVIAQAFLFFFAGLDTIQTALTFAAYEIAVNQDVQERLAEEIIPIMEKNNGALTYESVNEMAYLDMVVSETLRKNPPAFVTERKCTADYKIPETDLVIPKGMSLMIPINAVHHDENYYPDPEKFNPENFNAENKAKRHPYAYLPFGIGPRNCIAMRFALVETKAALAHLIYNFKIEPCAKTVIPMIRDRKTTKPVSCWLKFQPRMSNAN
jgi:cytochrome P450